MTRSFVTLVLFAGVGCAVQGDPPEGGGGTGGGSPTECPSRLGGPAMTFVATPSGHQYCIDTTEVTQSQYQQFLEAKVALTDQPHALCNPEFNPSFEPRPANHPPDHPGECIDTYDPSQKPDHAMTCIDFCDAIAYCGWAGKRLCGAMSRPGEIFGADHSDESGEFYELGLDPEIDQWFNVCSAKGQYSYPYGGNFEAGRCAWSSDSVWSAPACATVELEPPVLNVLGNVHEWQDYCTDSRLCRVGGPTALAEQDGCASIGLMQAKTVTEVVGFRCCYEFSIE